jgi:glutaredoxin
MTVRIVTKKYCEYCEMSKELLQGMELEYEEQELDTHILWEDVVNERPAEVTTTTVPQIWIDDKYIGGYRELVKWSMEN